MTWHSGFNMVKKELDKVIVDHSITVTFYSALLSFQMEMIPLIGELK